MTKPSAFQATFSDFRLVRSRKVCQFVLECPIESADAALEALGGLPRPDKEAWVAVARIDQKAVSQSTKGEEVYSIPPGGSVEIKPRHRKFNELPMVTQAAMLSEDKKFTRFLTETRGPLVDDPADIVRAYCGVQSRAEILPGTKAGNRWALMLSAYEAWMHDVEHVG